MADNSAQNTAQALEDAKKKMRELNEEVKRLGGQGFGDVNALISSMGNNITNANKQVQLMQDEVNDLKNAFSNISDTLKNVIADINGSTKASTLLTRNFNKLEDYSRKIQEHKSEENVLTVKQLKELQKKVGKEMDSLKTNLLEAKAQETILKRKQAAGTITKSESDELQKNLAYQKEINNAIADQESYLNKIVPLTAKEVEEEKKLQKTLGITGNLFKGITGALEKIGIQSEYFEDMGKKLREAAKSGSQLQVLGTGIKGIFSGVGQALADPVGKFLLLIALGKKLLDFGLHFNKTASELGKNYGLAGEAARGLTHQIEYASVASNNLYFNSKNIIEAQQQLNDELGTSAILSDELTQGQIDLTKKLGLSGEEAAKLSQYSLTTGKSQEKIVYEITKANKGLISNKKLLQEVAKTEGQLAAFYKNDPILIAGAIKKAKELGMTLEQTKSTTDGLLDIESSLANEYEAEMLIGKNIELSKARELALQGKTAEAAEEMLKNVGGIAEFQQMNRIQQEALAKSMNMSADDLAKTLTQQERLGKLTQDQRDKVAELRAAGKDEQADLLEKNAGNDKALKLAEMQLDTEEKLAQAGQKFKDIIASLVGGPIGALLDGLSSALSVINDIFKVLSVLKVPLMIIGGIFGSIWAAAKGIQLAETITTALQGKKLTFSNLIAGNTIRENLFKVKNNAQAAVELATERGKVSFKQLNSALEKESFLTKTQAYGIALKEWAVAKWKALTGKEQLVTDQSTLLVQQQQNATEQAGLLVRIRKGLVAAKDYVVQKGIALFSKLQTVYEEISLTLKQKGLALTIKDFLKSIGQAAMKAYSSAASIPFVGWILGAAAAAAVVGLGMKLMSKGDDVVSPGYGKRTLMAPEGAIALNDKDTVIAGTDLGGKKKGGGAATGGGGGGSIDIGPLVAAINEVKTAVDGIVNRSVEVYLDSTQIAQKIQTPIAVTARRTG
jgi:hypothetical protein